jgi:hypothetical protein
MSKQVVTPELQQWIIEQARAGCRPEDVLAAMRASGWDDEVAVRGLEDTLSQFLAQRANGADPAALPEPLPVPEPNLDGSPACVYAGDREVQVLLTLHHPRIVLFGGLLSDDECDALIAAARPRLSRSETVMNDTGGSEIHASRTSNGMFFGRGENPLCERIEQRIATLLRWPLTHGEGLQVAVLGHVGRPVQFVFQPHAQRVGGIGLAVHDQVWRGACRHAAQPGSSSSASAWPEKPSSWLTWARTGTYSPWIFTSVAPATMCAPRLPPTWKPANTMWCRGSGAMCLRWCSTRPPVAMPLAEMMTDGPALRRQPHRLLRRPTACARRRTARFGLARRRRAAAGGGGGTARWRRWPSGCPGRRQVGRDLAGGLQPLQHQQQRLRTAHRERRQQHAAAAADGVAHDVAQPHGHVFGGWRRLP